MLLYADTISLRCIAEPTFEPITLEEAKAHARIDIPDDDALITTMISAARKAAEGRLHRVLCESTWEWVLKAGPQEVKEVPVSPCFSCQSVKNNGAELGAGQYAFIASGSGGVSAPLYAVLNFSGETLAGDIITATVTAGYPAGKCPQDIRQWILVKITSFYEQRESFATGANIHEFSRGFFDHLLDPYILP